MLLFWIFCDILSLNVKMYLWLKLKLNLQNQQGIKSLLLPLYMYVFLPHARKNQTYRKHKHSSPGTIVRSPLYQLPKP